MVFEWTPNFSMLLGHCRYSEFNLREFADTLYEGLHQRWRFDFINDGDWRSSLKDRIQECLDELGEDGIADFLIILNPNARWIKESCNLWLVNSETFRHIRACKQHYNEERWPILFFSVQHAPGVGGRNRHIRIWMGMVHVVDKEIHFIDGWGVRFFNTLTKWMDTIGGEDNVRRKPEKKSK